MFFIPTFGSYRGKSGLPQRRKGAKKTPRRHAVSSSVSDRPRVVWDALCANRSLGRGSSIGRRFHARAQSAQRKAAKKRKDSARLLDHKGRPPDDSRIVQIRRAIMTRSYEFTQLDVFTETPFTGNP